MVEVATLQAQEVVGGNMDELRRLWVEVEELMERAKFYQGRYHTTVSTSQIEHYK